MAALLLWLYTIKPEIDNPPTRESTFKNVFFFLNVILVVKI